MSSSKPQQKRYVETVHTTLSGSEKIGLLEAELRDLKEQLETAQKKIDGHHHADLEENERFYRCLICEHIDALASNPAKRPM